LRDFGPFDVILDPVGGSYAALTSSWRWTGAG
jgi:hypothetical protein